MSRYIEMCKECIHYQMCHSINIDAPCAAYKNKTNVVEVVRCKDCKNWKDTSFDTVTEDHWGECRKPLGDYRCCETAENDFCSYGERREENEG